MKKRSIYDPTTQIYSSPRPPLQLPADQNTSLTDFLFRSAASHPDSVALIDAESGETMTFHQLRFHVSRMAHNLQTELGVSKNDVILIVAPNSIHFTVCFLAIVSIGAIATTCNPLYTVGEMSNQISDCNPKLIITVPQLVDKISDFNLPLILLNNGTDDSSSKSEKKNVICRYSDLIAAGAEEFEFPADVKQSDTAALFYSSGTSGKSKGVVLSHGNFMATSRMVTTDQDELDEPKGVSLCFLPMYHIFGFAVSTYAQLRRGNAVVAMERFELEKMLRSIERYKVTQMFVVPPVMAGLAKAWPAISQSFDLSSLNLVFSGASPIGKDLMVDCAKNLPHVNILQGYGMTEACGVISGEDAREGNRHSGSSGILCPGVEAMIIDIETFNPLKPNQIGEIFFRGPNVMQGYFNNDEATKQTIDDEGWVHTGDIGYFDEQGQLFVVDRLKELIKCGGFQVAPAEIEGLLLSHSEIVDAVVLPYPDVKAGEVPIAYVVCRDPKSLLSEANVQDFIAAQVASYKKLRRVKFVDQLPKSPTGKTLRRELIAQLRSEAEACMQTHVEPKSS
ncbi:unnamed protein product [Linum tenue]|uniref:4-coumarate--CoA ligase n=1 Tax=Linum tenue TaxID=586396 RepID=A0AAV0PVA7_9ROSI|nr:unnamed protein product [Linum tenue]